jgi:hypothetical protein
VDGHERDGSGEDDDGVVDRKFPPMNDGFFFRLWMPGLVVVNGVRPVDDADLITDVWFEKQAQEREPSAEPIATSQCRDRSVSI